MFSTTDKMGQMIKRMILMLNCAFVFFACKKDELQGVYSGTEQVSVVSNTANVNSTSAQTVTIDFQGSNCNYTSSTLLWTFERNQKTKRGYFHEDSDTYFYIEFKEDSLIADFKSGEVGNYTRRGFRGSR